MRLFSVNHLLFCPCVKHVATANTFALRRPAQRSSKSLTIVVRIRVCQRWDAHQDLAAVSLDHELQLPARLLNQFPCIVQREVLRHCAIDLQAETSGHQHETTRVFSLQICKPVIILTRLLEFSKSVLDKRDNQFQQ